MKSSTKFGIAFGLIFGILFLIEYNQEEPIDWTPGFSKTQKKPFGSYLLYSLLPSVFPDQKIETVNQSISDQLPDPDSITGVNYIFNDHNIEFKDFEVNTLLHFVSRGNTVFISSTYFTDTLMNSVALKLRSRYEDTLYTSTSRYYHFNFCSKLKTNDTGYTIRNDMMDCFFDSLGSTKYWVAGDAARHCILVEVDYGKGKFLLSTLPYAFTNYSLMRAGNVDFVINTLARMPLQTTWWDEYYKTGKSKNSPLYVILSRKGLRWAYYLGISGLVLFVIFMGKRRQRIIPIQDPMKNASLEFAETVGQVYYEKGDHLNLARKQIKYFYDFIRTKYQVNVSVEWKRSPRDFFEHLSNRSGMPVKQLEELFDFIFYIENSTVISTAQLLKLNTLLERFKTLIIT